MAKLHFVALGAELTVRGFSSHLVRAQLGFFPKVTRHEPFDERSARILYAGSPRYSGKSAKSAWRVLPATWPIALRDGITEWGPVLFSRRRTT